jgi:uroporphyrinogen decarboxylase
MTPRERILSAMHRQMPDRMPWSFDMTQAIQALFQQRTGARSHAEYYGFDFRGVGPRPAPDPPDYSRYYEGRSFRGRVTLNPEWGYASVQPDPASHFAHWESPFDGKEFTVRDAETFPLPDFDSPGRYEGVEERIRDHHRDGYAVRYIQGFGTFDYSWLIRGYESFLVDLLSGQAAAAVLMDRVSDRIASVLKHMAARGADIVGFGEDVGTQTSLIVSPATWRERIKPRFRKIVDAAKTARPDVLFFYHSDGRIDDIVPDLIEVGVDILNPVQPECVDPVEMKRRHGDRLSFWGGVGTQTTMPFGTPDQVRACVRYLFETVGRGGGFLCAPSHVLEPEVPWENVEAFVEACRECRY